MTTARLPTTRTTSLALLALVALLAGSVVACGSLEDPSSPNSPADLTGNNSNTEGSFSGSISITGGGGTAPADGSTDQLINVRVIDSAGNPIGNGISVNMATNLGTIRAFGDDPTGAGTSVRLGTFEGKASALLRSTVPGLATVTVWIQDVAITRSFEFERVPLIALLDTAFRTIGGDATTALGAAPARFQVVGKAQALDGSAVAGIGVRFRIVRDSTGSSGLGSAGFAAPVLSSTDSAGEATNTLEVFGVGSVTVNARLLDPVDGAVIFESNQIVATTTEISATTAIVLQFDDGSTTRAELIETPLGMTATVTDTLTGEPLRGVAVRFEIVEDNAENDGAVLAANGNSVTNTVGEAVNAVIGREGDTTAVLEVQMIDQTDGTVIARSNQIVVRFSPPEE